LWDIDKDLVRDEDEDEGDAGKEQSLGRKELGSL
jgi:hypothetical protein